MDRKASIVNSESSHDKRTTAEYKSKHSGPRQSIAPPSVQRGRRLSVQLSRKSSQDLLAVPKIKLQNTYRIEPEEDEKFRPYKIEPIIKDILKAHLDDKTYEHSKTERLTKDLTREILNKTKQNNISQRYKIVSHVAIGELKGKNFFKLGDPYFLMFSYE